MQKEEWPDMGQFLDLYLAAIWSSRPLRGGPPKKWWRPKWFGECLVRFKFPKASVNLLLYMLPEYARIGL